MSEKPKPSEPGPVLPTVELKDPIDGGPFDKLIHQTNRDGTPKRSKAGTLCRRGGNPDWFRLRFERLKRFDLIERLFGKSEALESPEPAIVDRAEATGEPVKMSIPEDSSESAGEPGSAAAEPFPPYRREVLKFVGREPSPEVPGSDRVEPFPEPGKLIPDAQPEAEPESQGKRFDFPLGAAAVNSYWAVMEKLGGPEAPEYQGPGFDNASLRDMMVEAFNEAFPMGTLSLGPKSTLAVLVGVHASQCIAKPKFRETVRGKPGQPGVFTIARVLFGVGVQKVKSWLPWNWKRNVSPEPGMKATGAVPFEQQAEGGENADR